MSEPLDVLLEFEVDDETSGLLLDKVGSDTEYFASLLADEFKVAMYEKLLAHGRRGTRDEVLAEWIKETAKNLKDTSELYMVPNPIRLKE